MNYKLTEYHYCHKLIEGIKTTKLVFSCEEDSIISVSQWLTDERRDSLEFSEINPSFFLWGLCREWGCDNVIILEYVNVRLWDVRIWEF